jgi:ribosomal protein S18 acetylase RimI-like enzyme
MQEKTGEIMTLQYSGRVMAKKNDLSQHIDKLHTTQMGAERIRRNLNLRTEYVVDWCKEAVKQADVIIGQGKNLYVYGAGTVITINAHSFTVITAHKINASVRVMREADYDCLRELLYQAIYIPAGEEFPPRSIINAPEIFVYIKDFGRQPGDFGVVAEQNGQVVGAAWTRIIPAYGHVDGKTPELAISILPEFRNYGIGTKLMKKLFEVLRKNGYKQTSLSVQKDNPAVRFYQRLGYKMAGERPGHAGNADYLMIKDLL